MKAFFVNSTILLIFSTVLGISSAAFASERGLFSSQELDRLKRLKSSSEHLIFNAKELEKRGIYELYRTELLIMSKAESKRREQMTALKEMDKFDQHYLFNRIMDRKMRQKWYYPTPKPDQKRRPKK